MWQQDMGGQPDFTEGHASLCHVRVEALLTAADRSFAAVKGAYLKCVGHGMRDVFLERPLWRFIEELMQASC